MHCSAHKGGERALPGQGILGRQDITLCFYSVRDSVLYPYIRDLDKRAKVKPDINKFYL